MRALFVAAVAVLVVADLPAYAQSENRTETVLTRPRPELDPLNIRLGGFTLSPKLEVTETYDSNIFSVELAETEDYIATISPSLRLNSNWNNHAIGINARADIKRYMDHDAEDAEAYTFGGNGRIDIRRDMKVDGGVGYQVQTEERGSPDDVIFCFR